MESAPTNRPESYAEKIHTKEEILSFLGGFIEGAQTIARELSDEKGLYLLEVETAGVTPGETVEYNYTRKGHHQTNITAIESTIEVTYYQDGVPVSGTTFARIDPSSGAWRKL